MLDHFEFLKNLVSIGSATGNFAGVNRVQNLVKQRLETLGFKCELVRNSQHGSGDLLFGCLNPGGEKALTLVCHADTVFDSTELQVLDVVGDKLVGPGVADNKGGITVLLAGLSWYLQKASTKHCLRVVCSPNEETGSHGYHQLFYDLGEKSNIILGFEPATTTGDIIDSRCGNRWYFLESQGREAHAGRADGEEINAGHDIVFKIQEILSLKKMYPDLRVNVAKISGGKERYNIVCGHASAKIDIRYATTRTRDEVHQKIIDIVHSPHVRSKDGQIASGTWRMDDDCPPLEPGPMSGYLSQTYRTLIERLEQTSIAVQFVGGASDVNHFSQKHNASLCGLGPVGGDLHTGREYVVRSTIETRGQALAQFLTQI